MGSHVPHTCNAPPPCIPTFYLLPFPFLFIFCIFPKRYASSQACIVHPLFTSPYCIRTLPRGGMYWEIHPPRPERFPKGGDFAPRGPRDFPRAKPEGNLEGRGVQNPRPREISRAEGDVFPNASRLEAVYVHSLSISREVLILWCVCGQPFCRTISCNYCR